MITVSQSDSIFKSLAKNYMYGCTDRAKAAAYLTLMRPCLEYCNVVWTLYTTKNINMIESVQCRAAKWIKVLLTHLLFSGPNLVMNV